MSQPNLTKESIVETLEKATDIGALSRIIRLHIYQRTWGERCSHSKSRDIAVALNLIATKYIVPFFPRGG